MAGSSDDLRIGHNSNELSGVVHGPAVQARDIHGGVHVTVEPVADRPPVPAQLPPGPSILAGRTAELAALDEMTADHDPLRRFAVAVITGVGGVGKTALASYWAHRMSERYPGGILYADLAGHTPASAVSASAVLVGFLTSLGMAPENIPLALDEQAKLFRSLTAGRRMLTFLDNAASAAQVRALLPGPGPATDDVRVPASSVVLVTTRWRIAGLAMDGAHFLELRPLDERSSAEILRRMVGQTRAAAEPDAVRDLVRLCGGLPLAVCVAGAQLALHPRRPLSRLVADLANERDRLARLKVGDDVSVRSAFDFSYQALPSEAARFYRLLSLLFSPDFGIELAAAHAEISHAEAAGLLELLAGASLLEEIADWRFRFHDLVKLHAREHAQMESPDDRVAAVSRSIDWYLRSAMIADRVLLPGRWRLTPAREQAASLPPTAPDAALTWLEDELPGLVAAVHTAHEARLHERAWQLCDALSGLFSHRKHFSQWIETHRTGVASAVACSNQSAEAWMRVRLGLAYLYLGRTELADAQFQMALRAARQASHRIGEATALEHVGLARLAYGQPGPAAERFHEALAIYTEIDEPRGILVVTRRLGEAYRDAGRYDQAIRCLAKARELCVAMDEPYHEMRSLTGLGQAYAEAGQPQSAVTVLNGALDIAVHTGARYEQARVRAALANVELALGELAEAEVHLTEAFAIYSDLGAPEAEIVARLLTELQ